MHKQQLELGLKPVPRVDAEMRLKAIASSFYEAIDTPKSLAAYILLKAGEYAQLVSMEVDPSDYLCAEAYDLDALASKFLSKYPGFSHEDLDPKGKAQADFLKYELDCKSTNQRLRRLKEDPSLWDPRFRDILYLARRKISKVLGKLDLAEIADHFGWGPGATSVSKGNLTSAYVKFSQRLDVTGNSLVIGQCCVNSTPSWVNCQLQTGEFPSVEASLLETSFTVVRGNEIVFVPKNAKTHRVIAIEPHVNSYLQKGVGRVIRKKLRDVGVDLNDQSRNQHLAQVGSLSGDLATIDLSGASDTISKELVHLLLPDLWYKFMASLRSPQGLLESGSWIFYEKFSSMGNGFTFELESLIFWALCASTLVVDGYENVVSVYGDDLIVPSVAYNSVSEVLSFCGFTVNSSKSYDNGPFRESCGKDYFHGTAVRPIYLKEDLSNVESLYRLANSIRRLAHRRRSYGCDARFERVWKAIVSEIPNQFRYRIPEGFGDVGLISNFDEASPSRARNGWEGFHFKGVIRVPVKRQMRDLHAGYTACLSAIGPSLDTEREEHWPWVPKKNLCSRSLAAFNRAMRDFVTRYELKDSPLLGYHSLRRMTRPKVAQIHTRGWYDFGPWQ